MAYPTATFRSPAGVIARVKAYATAAGISEGQAWTQLATESLDRKELGHAEQPQPKKLSERRGLAVWRWR